MRSADTNQLVHAIWRALTPNERRVARALATSPAPLHSEETATLVGIKRTSIGRALEGLEAKADVIKVDGRPRPTDPLFEYWLKTKGMLPADGGDDTG